MSGLALTQVSMAHPFCRASQSFTPASTTPYSCVLCTQPAQPFPVGIGCLYSGAVAIGDYDLGSMFLFGHVCWSDHGRESIFLPGRLTLQWTQNVFLNDSGLREGCLGARRVQDSWK